MAEISGGLLLAGVLLMMVLCLGQIRVDYLQEMAEAERISGAAVVQGGYLFFVWILRGGPVSVYHA